jgi:hypothetical protein
MLMWVPMRVSAVKCSDACSRLSTEEPCIDKCWRKQHCECCFERNPGQEDVSTLRWWTNWKPLDGLYERLAWFRNREMYGPIVDSREDTLIAGVLYTHSMETLKMTVLFPPLFPEESREATVFLVGMQTATVWERKCKIKDGTWHCLVRFDDIPHSESYMYEVKYTVDPTQIESQTSYFYSGSVPIQKDYPRMAGVGCFGVDSTKNKDDLREAIIAQDPDIVILQGDQTYFHSNVSTL